VLASEVLTPAIPCRRFTLLDAMFLIAATAVGLGCMRFLDTANGGMPDVVGMLLSHNPATSSWDYSFAIFYALEGFKPLLVTWTLAALSLRLRRPRPRINRLARQPGFAALLVAISLWGFSMVVGLVGVMVTPLLGWSFPERLIFALRSGDLGWLGWHAGSAVAGVWMIMALGRFARREPGWVDWLGRILGIVWVVLWLGSQVFTEMGT
jgi:hypothetical protein